MLHSCDQKLLRCERRWESTPKVKLSKKLVQALRCAGFTLESTILMLETYYRHCSVITLLLVIPSCLQPSWLPTLCFPYINVPAWRSMRYRVWGKFLLGLEGIASQLFESRTAHYEPEHPSIRPIFRTGPRQPVATARPSSTQLDRNFSGVVLGARGIGDENVAQRSETRALGRGST